MELGCLAYTVWLVDAVKVLGAPVVGVRDKPVVGVRDKPVVGVRDKPVKIGGRALLASHRPRVTQ
jgi:hypothetical protein